MSDPHASYDALVALALDDADQPDPSALDHLAACGPCRSRYDEVVAGVEQVLAATPRIDPPPGFDRTVLGAMGMAPATETRPPRRRRLSLALAAGVLGVLLGAGGAVVWAQLDDTAPPGAAVAASLDTAEGESVGSVTRSYLDGEPVMVVSVHDGVVGTRYDCVLVLDGGRTRAVGSWVMESPEATWVVAAPPAGVDAVRLVTGEGSLWSAADLGS